MVKDEVDELWPWYENKPGPLILYLCGIQTAQTSGWDSSSSS